MRTSFKSPSGTGIQAGRLSGLNCMAGLNDPLAQADKAILFPLLPEVDCEEAQEAIG